MSQFLNLQLKEAWDYVTQSNFKLVAIHLPAPPICCHYRRKPPPPAEKKCLIFTPIRIIYAKTDVKSGRQAKPRGDKLFLRAPQGTPSLPSSFSSVFTPGKKNEEGGRVCRSPGFYLLGSAGPQHSTSPTQALVPTFLQSISHEKLGDTCLRPKVSTESHVT